MKNKALVIFSGGQDSTTCLYWAKNRYKVVEAITFSYGQKHIVEIEQSKKICKKLGVRQTIVDISFLGTLVESALTSNGDVNVINEKGLPNSFVPNRNQLFITLAHAFAQKINTNVLVAGMCETDFSGYPDCRRDFLDLLIATTDTGSGLETMEEMFTLETPLMYLNKAETFLLAEKEGCLEEVIEHSHTCYEGDRTNLHVWGYGCGSCPACKLRQQGYELYKKMKHVKK